ncbi:hypothetical protein TRVL_05826 [Trypanosoma vivax]|nr:hypothetical protein TRVL_05826 [Trypanosoma vivax]
MEEAKLNNESMRGSDIGSMITPGYGCGDLGFPLNRMEHGAAKRACGARNPGATTREPERPPVVEITRVSDGMLACKESAKFPTPALPSSPDTSQSKKSILLPARKRRREGIGALGGTGTSGAALTLGSSSSASGNDVKSSGSSTAPFSAAARNGRGESINGSISQRHLTREQPLTGSSRLDEQLKTDIMPNPQEGGVPRQLLQRGGDGCMCASPENDYDNVEGGCSPAPANVLSSPSSGITGWSPSRKHKQDLQSHLAAAISCYSMSYRDKEGGVTVPLERIFMSAVQQRMAENDYTSERDIYDATTESTCRGSDLNYRFLNDEDGEDMNGIKIKMKLMKYETIRELAALWNVLGNDEDTTRTNVLKRIRILSIVIILVVIDRSELQGVLLDLCTCGSSSRMNSHGSSSNAVEGEKGAGSVSANDTEGSEAVGHSGAVGSSDREARRYELMASLRHKILSMAPENCKEFAKQFHLEKYSHSQEEIFTIISAVGILVFFLPLPIALLKEICRELSISIGNNTAECPDPHQLPEFLAEKITRYFCPQCQPSIDLTKLRFMPQMQIHEHAPGRYTCTIDNAELLKELPLHRLVSNRFSCNKIKWHALLVVRSDALNFYVWHRHTAPLRINMVIRTQEPKKRRNTAGEGNADEGSNQATLRERSALFLEKEVEAAPGELVGFENFVDFQVAFRSFISLQCGYRLYNRAEDRLTFQYAMELKQRDGTPFTESDNKKVAAHSKNSSTKCTEANSTDRVNDVQSLDTADTAAAVVAMDEKRLKELEKVVAKLEKSEAQERENVKKMWSNGHRQLLNEFTKASQKAAQKKERERKTIVSKVGPSPGLQRKLNQIIQTVNTVNEQVEKLSKEKAEEEEMIRSYRERIEEVNAEIRDLQKVIGGLAKSLYGNGRNASNLSSHRSEQAEMQRCEEKQPLMPYIPELHPTRHETLAINDLQSFWSPSAINGTNAESFPDAPLHSSPMSQRSPIHHTGITRVTSPLGDASSRSNSEGPSIPPSRSAVVRGISGNNGLFSTAQSSVSPPSVGDSSQRASATTGGLLGTGLSYWFPTVEPFSFTMRDNGISTETFDQTLGVFSQPSPFSQIQPVQNIDISHLTGTDAIGLRSQAQNKCNNAGGGGFTVSAPFSSSDSVSRFTLDANAHPFTPTPLAAAKAVSNNAAHSFFVVSPGAATRVSPYSTSPTSVFTGSGTTLTPNGFPEKPRYTSVSAPVSNPMANSNASAGTGAVGSLGGAGLFDADALLPTSSHGLTGNSDQRGSCRGDGCTLNFTTAPWN